MADYSKLTNPFTNANGDISFGSIVNALSNFSNSVNDIGSTSLFQYTRRSIVSSRVFIDQTLASADVLNPLMLNIMNLYAGLIMTAVNLNQQITSTKTVRDTLAVVATEDFKVEFAEELMDNYFAGCNFKSTMTANVGEQAPAADNVASEEEAAANTPATVNDRSRDDRPNTIKGSDSRLLNKDIAAGMDIPIPSGRVIQVTFDTNRSGKFVVNILLQLHPTYVSPEVIQQFISLNFKPTLKQRWLQMSAGEISFFTDFLLGNDLRRKRFDALRKDRTGALSEMIDAKDNAVANMWMKLLPTTPDRQNIANTILIYDKRTFEKACSGSGINFKSYANRQRFFRGTMAMLVAVVDVMYNKVEIFYNGISTSSVFTFDQLKKNAKTESTDILAMMKNYAQGMAPRF